MFLFRGDFLRAQIKSGEKTQKGPPFPFGGGRALGVKCGECAAEAYSMAAWAAERRAMGTRKGEQLT